MSAAQAGEASGLRKSTVRKHLGSMRASGVIESRPARDGRKEVYYLRPSRRPAPGILEFGECCIMLGRPPAPPAG